MGWRDRLTDDEARRVAEIEARLDEIDAVRDPLRAELRRIMTRAAVRDGRAKPD